MHRADIAVHMRTLNLKQAAAFLHMHPNTVQERAKAGTIPAAKPGKLWVFIEDDLVSYLRGLYDSGKTKEVVRVSTRLVIPGISTSSGMDRDLEILLAPRKKTRATASQ
jgi:excisionase family DNA binding protein